MRRFLLPAVVLAIAIVASVLAGNANDAAEPDDPPADTTTGTLTTPLISVRRTPEWLRQPTTSSLLDIAVRRPVDAVGDAGLVCASVHVNGTSVTEVAIDLPLTAGEIQRLLTVAALDAAGTRPFTTEVVRAPDVTITEDGVLEGDLWLIGGADPVLSTNAYISRFDDGRAFTSLEELALSTAAVLLDEGVSVVSGRIIGVDSKYDGSPPVFGIDTWSDAEVASGVVGVTSGLLVNNGITNAATSESPEANVRTSNAVVHAADEFAAILEIAGVTVQSGSISGDAPATSARLSVASIESPPMEEIARRAVIDGTTAEMLWREAAVRSGGSAAGLLDVLGGVNVALVEQGLLDDDVAGNYPKYDGSGLSIRSRARCVTFTGVLDPDATALAATALPVIDDSALSACAPTGLDSLHVLAAARPEATSMAGRAVASNGDVITFSVIANWLPTEEGTLAPQDVCDGLLPAVLDAIAEHPAGPSIEDLTPLDPILPE